MQEKGADMFGPIDSGCSLTLNTLAAVRGRNGQMGRCRSFRCQSAHLTLEETQDPSVDGGNVQGPCHQQMGPRPLDLGVQHQYPPCTLSILIQGKPWKPVCCVSAAFASLYAPRFLHLVLGTGTAAHETSRRLIRSATRCESANCRRT